MDPGAVMELKEDGVPWNVPMPKEGGRVFTVCDATCCKRPKKTWERKRKRHRFTPQPSAQAGVAGLVPKEEAQGHAAPQSGSRMVPPWRAGSGRQWGARAYT